MVDINVGLFTMRNLCTFAKKKCKTVNEFNASFVVLRRDCTYDSIGLCKTGVIVVKDEQYATNNAENAIRRRVGLNCRLMQCACST